MNNHTSLPRGRQGRQDNNSNHPNGIYGDHLKQKRSGMVRILFQNPQGLGSMKGGSPTQSLKTTNIRETLIKHSIDIVGFSEVNKDWRAIPQQDTMWQVTDGWFEYRMIQTSINHKVAAMSATQYGGTLMMAMNHLAYSIIIAEDDERKLGRWSSILVRRKNQHLCRIICAYCPCKSSRTNSTYALQVVGLAKANITVCPRKQFWVDLKQYIKRCQDNDEHVIIMGDWNSKYIEVVRWMQQLGLVDIIHQRHSTTTPPPTLSVNFGTY
jgi:Endonuclease/Exonuclease/phosphatase family.